MVIIDFMYAMFGKMVAFHFRELAFFYPDFVAPTIVQKRKKKRLQRTLALIRPDALRTRKGNLAYLNSRSNSEKNYFSTTLQVKIFGQWPSDDQL